MIFRFCFSLICLLTVAQSCSAASKDPRLTLISEQELKRLIQQTPLNIPGHTKLISRASRWNLARLAYDQYTLIWKKKPNDLYSNLLRGLSARYYMDEVNNPLRQRQDKRAYLKQANSLHLITRSCLAKAIKLKPNLALANLSYGFFLWQYDNRMSDGLKLLRKAAAIEPNDPRIHATLGSVYSNESGNAYNPQKAEEELNTAIRLDSSYAHPYWVKVTLFTSLKRYAEAQREMQIYINLTPEGTAQNPGVQLIQSAIDKGLGKK